MNSLSVPWKGINFQFKATRSPNRGERSSDRLVWNNDYWSFNKAHPSIIHLLMYRNVKSCSSFLLSFYLKEHIFLPISSFPLRTILSSAILVVLSGLKAPLLLAIKQLTKEIIAMVFSGLSISSFKEIIAMIQLSTRGISLFLIFAFLTLPPNLPSLNWQNIIIY